MCNLNEICRSNKWNGADDPAGGPVRQVLHISALTHQNHPEWLRSPPQSIPATILPNHWYVEEKKDEIK